MLIAYHILEDVEECFGLPQMDDIFRMSYVIPVLTDPFNNMLFIHQSCQFNLFTTILP
jgi:hypothetical protein